MKRFVEGEARSQMSLLPASLDDHITEDNPVRVVEAFIDALDLEKLGFAGMVPQSIEPLFFREIAKTIFTVC